MSSYNNIRKIKYTKTPSDVVSLHEYIIFENSHAKEKYVVFRFSNNLNQHLLAFKFEVLQYNKDNELLEKSTVIHENFSAEANSLFVPNAKLKINFECVSLEVKLVSASFDRVVWSDGEFKDNSYRFESYAQTVSKPVRATYAEQDRKKDRKTVNKKDKKNKKKNKLGFVILDIFRKNKAKFPAVFNVILCALVIGLVIFSTFYFKRVTGAFTADSFIVKESSTGYVTILDYVGSSDEIVIPSTLEVGEKSYNVTKIAKGAFTDSKVKSIEIKTHKSLVIETGAFINCKKLTDVTGEEYCGEIILMEGAFRDCKALKTFIVPTAVLCAKCFDGTNNIKRFVFEGVVFEEGRLLDVFNGLKSITFEYFPMYGYYQSNSPEFVEGVSVSR